MAQLVAPAPNQTLLAAVSGGADSVALSALLQRCAQKAGARLLLAHVNHAIRSISWQDEAVALAVGAALGVRVLTRRLAEGAHGEARLRTERYAALSEMAREAGASRIFTAHHAEDQSETVLLALFRGAGPQALRGMSAKRPLTDGLTLERPLLRTSPSVLSAYCSALRLPVVFDQSNRDYRYRRNALRRALVDLRESFPHLDEAVARCAEIACENDAQSERARIRERLREELRSKGALRDVTFERLDAVAAALEGGRRGRHFLRRGTCVEVAGEFAAGFVISPYIASLLVESDVSPVWGA